MLETTENDIYFDEIMQEFQGMKDLASSDRRNSVFVNKNNNLSLFLVDNFY